MIIRTIKLKQYFLWFLAYLPIILIIIFRARINSEVSENSCYLSLIFVFISLLIYFFSGKIYLFVEKKRVSDTDRRTGSIKSKNTLPISEYSYFILTLFMPLLFEDISNILDYTVFGTLILLILIIFTKNDYIIVNPLFLLANYHVFKVRMINIDKEIKGYAIVNKKIDLDKKIYYKKIFTNVFFIFDEVNEKNNNVKDN